jgi:hypothetical protein
VLARPEIPLHTNASENDLHACVIKRKISGGMMSAHGRLARDLMLGLVKTFRKLGLSFFTYLGDRLGLNSDEPKLPPVADFVIQAAWGLPPNLLRLPLKATPAPQAKSLTKRSIAYPKEVKYGLATS